MLRCAQSLLSDQRSVETLPPQPDPNLMSHEGLERGAGNNGKLTLNLCVESFGFGPGLCI